MKIKALNLDNHYWELPASMTMAQISALIGQLAVLRRVTSHYNFDNGSSMYEVTSYVQVTLVDLELTPNAKAVHEESYAKYNERKAA